MVPEDRLARKQEVGDAFEENAYPAEERVRELEKALQAKEEELRVARNESHVNHQVALIAESNELLRDRELVPYLIEERNRRREMAQQATGTSSEEAG